MFVKQLTTTPKINKMNTTKTNEQILAEFNALFAQANQEAAIIVANAINPEAIEVLKSKTATLKQYIIEDVTPSGYGI